jgi:hypothetical protein
MARYLHQGWFETFLPVRCGAKSGTLRVWVEMDQILPLLRQLDRLYGSEVEPYCRDLSQVRAAQETLARLIVELLAERPAALKRACAPAELADHLAAHHRVRRADLPLPSPPWLDQVDVEPADLAPVLSALFDPATSHVAGQS